MTEDAQDGFAPHGDARPDADHEAGRPAWERNAGRFDRPSSGVLQEEPLVAAALDYAARGWPVFPCNPANKQPLLAADKDAAGKSIRGTGGVSKATTDAAQIRAWWRRWPKAMIGLATGHERMFAVDFDPRHDDATGEEWTLERLKGEVEAQIGVELPPTLAVRTPSDGVHLYFRQCLGEPIRNRGNLPDHVDVRGLGGYVIAPPSLMTDGREYRWLRGQASAAIADAPGELLAVLRQRGQPAARGAPAASAPATTMADPGEAVRKYALAALDGICRDVGSAGSGNRNAALNQGAFGAAQLVAAGALSASVARAAVLDAARANPGRDGPGQIEATFESGWSAGLEQPRDLSEIGRVRSPSRRSGSQSSSTDPLTPASEANGKPSSLRGGAAGQVITGGRGQGPGRRVTGPDLDRACAHRAQTDLGNLERFLDRHGDDFLFVEQWGWLAWDGKRWSREQAVPLLGRAVQQTMRAIQDEGRAVKNSGWKRDSAPLLHVHEECDDGLDYIARYKGKDPVSFSATLFAWGRTSESAGHIGCIAKMAESRLAARVQDFDADPLSVNVANGTLVFTRPAEKGGEAKVELRSHDRADRMTKIAEVAFDPSATSPKYDAFLAEVQPIDEMRDFLDCWAGYNSLGLADAQKMAVFYGTGSNGKGVWINTHGFILGDYAWAAGIETFIDQGKYRKGSDASPDLAALAGRRMVYANEPEEGSKFSDGLVKAMTSDEPIGGVRELNKSPFELHVTFTNTVSANNKPKIGTDHGIQRRMQLVPWDVTIPDERADAQLKDKLKAEAAGIFNRIVRGALAYLSTGLPQPEAVRTATREYLDENDLLGQFIAMCVVEAKGETVGATPLHRLFAAWQTWSNQLAASGKPWSPKYLNGQMQKKGFTIMKSSTMQWQDIALAFDPEDFAEQDDKGHWRAVTAALREPRRMPVAAGDQANSQPSPAPSPGREGPGYDDA